MSIFDNIREKMMAGMAGQKTEMHSAEDQTQDEKALTSYVKGKVEEGRGTGARIAQEGIWMTNTAYLLGFDSVFYDTSTRQFKPVGVNRATLRRGRIHVNKILPIINNRLARLTKSPPKYDIKPESPTNEDKDSARLGLEIINDVWDKQHINHKRIEAVMWAQQCGYSFKKVSWDPTLGKPMVDPDSNEVIGFEGDIRVDAVSPFEMFQDPLAKTLEECQWLCQAKVRKLEYFRSTFPDRGHLVKEENAWLLSAQYELRINSLNNQGPVSSGTETQMKDAAIELAFYERRSKKYPKGRLIIVANGVLLHDGELPVGDLPFVKFDDTVVAGKFCPESIITHLRPIQDQLNRVIAKRADWTNKLLAGKFIAAKGHGMHSEALDDQSGEVIEYNPVANASPPTQMSIPVIPSYAYEEETRLNDMLNDISGIGELSRGQLPQAGIPAIGMQFLQEQDETRLGVITQQHEQAYAGLGGLILRYAAAFYQRKRVLKIAGKGLNYAVKEFVGSDIKNNFDVFVVPGSTLPNSKTLKRQELINAYNMGIMGPQQDVNTIQKLLEGLEFGDVNELWRDFSLDMQCIQEAIKMIEEGVQPPISEFDNHTLYIQELNRFRKTDKFRGMDAKKQLLLLDLMNAHVNSMVKLQNPGLEQQTKLAEEMHNVNLEQQDAELPATDQLAETNALQAEQLQQDQPNV